jgi:hypothetical protein
MRTMCRKKILERTLEKASLPPENGVVFVSPEGIRSLEEAIRNLEHIYKEMGEMAKRNSPEIEKNSKNREA